MTINIIDKEILDKLQDSEVVLSVQGVSKKFCRDLRRSLAYGIQDIASELIGLRRKTEELRHKEFWALKDVSFELRRGEALALVGKNGSGKSTMLRIVAGLINPDSGSVEVKGRLAPLIALGAGFNPILTGRENIYANMSILGVPKKEIDERFDAVVEFSEIGDAIDAPVQSYSSGMAARLGFASAIHTEPDILLIDEVLAVGDIRFREKCHRKLQDLRRKGTSFVLVSHNNHELSNVCESAVYLSKGKLMASGSAFSVLEQYEEELFPENKEKPDGEISILEKPANESLGLDIISLYFRDSNGNIVKSPVTGEQADLCVECKVHRIIETLNAYALIEKNGEYVLNISSFHDEKQFNNVSVGNHEIRIRMPHLGLNPGLYQMSFYLKEGSLFTLDLVESFKFKVSGKHDINHSLFYQPRVWEIGKPN